jgi:hypothetical protein
MLTTSAAPATVLSYINIERPSGLNSAIPTFQATFQDHLSRWDEPAGIRITGNLRWEQDLIIPQNTIKSEVVILLMVICTTSNNCKQLFYLIAPLARDQTLQYRYLRIDDTACRSANRYIVCQYHKLDVQDLTLPHPTDRNTSTVLEISIESRLRPIRLFVYCNRVSWGARAAKRLSIRRKSNQRLPYLLRARWWSPRKAHRNTFGMSINDWDSVARGRNTQWVCCVHVKAFGTLVVLCDATENLECLPFQFFFLAAYIRDNVVHYVETCDSRVSRTRNGLQSGDKKELDGTKCFFKRTKRDNTSCRGTVCVCNYEAIFQRWRVRSLLLGNDREMGGINKGNNKGDLRIAPVVFRIGKYSEISSSEGSLCSYNN